MYLLQDSLLKVKGIGTVTAKKFAEQNLKTVQDLLLYVPLNYADLSQVLAIYQLQPGQSCTVKAQVVQITEYFKNGKRLTKAVIADETGRTNCIWFNNRFIKQQLKKGEEYFFAGTYSSYRNFAQPKVEEIKAESIHTGRLVPRYSQTLKIKQGKMRLILKEIVANLAATEDKLAQEFKLLPLKETLTQLHFPDEQELVIEARKRLAIEELLALMKKSSEIKKQWRQQQSRAVLPKMSKTEIIPEKLPFTLTADQQQAVQEIMTDLTKDHAMNRLLIGDVGTGKTVVAGIAAKHVLQAGLNVALIAPTQILAEQHLQSFKEMFPEIKTELLTAKTTAKTTVKRGAVGLKTGKDSAANEPNPSTKLFIGTHAVINQLDVIQPGLVIYDEQHRFGVAQRASALADKQKKTQAKQPHILTMSATPIPRSYMLTIFAHLQVSLIKEFPFGKKQTKTWHVPPSKKADAYDWVAQQLQKNQKGGQTSPRKLALIICPFIDQSEIEEFKDVPSATQVFTKLQKKWQADLEVELLHGQQKPDQQEKIIQRLFKDKIDVLVATSIVEVGVDLPQANIILIEGADRFGLASLHQLRGRVGRKSQQSYCLVFSSGKSQETIKRLKLFAQENDGLKLAELDLKNRGPGDLFGLEQHGLDNLRFASWNNLELIAQAQQIFKQLKNQDLGKNWQPLFVTEAGTSQKISQN